MSVWQRQEMQEVLRRMNRLGRRLVRWNIGVARNRFVALVGSVEQDVRSV